MHSSTRLFTLPFLLTALAFAANAGCSDDGSPSGTPDADAGGTPTDTDGGTTAAPCTGSGTVKVTLGSAPVGVAPKVLVGTTMVTFTGDTGTVALPAGEYPVTAERVVAPDPIVRKVYLPSLSVTKVSACSEKPAEFRVEYLDLPSSNKVWMSNANGTATTLGFASADLGATGTVVPVEAKTQGGKGITFDKEGNLWAIGNTVGDPTLLRYPAGILGTTGDKTADRKIDIANTGCSPLAQSLAFDASGNLWVSLLCENKVVRIDAAKLAGDGEVTPSVEVTGLTAPRGIAFDAFGNLLVADGAVLAYSVTRLGASISTPDATLTMPEPAEDLAFDAGGDLWVVGGSEINLTRIAKADLPAPGARTPTPVATISVGVAALPQGIAFDESGGLWISTSAGKVARLGPSQLGTSTTYAAPTVPERVISSSSIGSGGSIALFPAPAALPIHHRMD
jgi:streptogramin lyase